MPLLTAGGWTGWPLKAPSHPKHWITLWFGGAGVRQTCARTGGSCCVYVEGPELAFRGSPPPAALTQPGKIPCVTLVWGFRCGSPRASTSRLLSRFHGLGMSLVATSAVLQNRYFHPSVSLEQTPTSLSTACFNVASSENE